MSMAHELLLPFATGAVLGAFYWGTLWLLSRRVMQFRRPLLSIAAGSLIRMGLLCTGLYIASAGSWKGLLAALAGVVAVRILAICLVRRESAASIKETSDAVQS